MTEINMCVNCRLCIGVHGETDREGWCDICKSKRWVGPVCLDSILAHMNESARIGAVAALAILSDRIVQERDELSPAMQVERTLREFSKTLGLCVEFLVPRGEWCASFYPDHEKLFLGDTPEEALRKAMNSKEKNHG